MGQGVAGIDHVDVSDPDLITITEFRGHATLVLGGDMMMLKGLDAGSLNLDDILV